MGDYEVDFGIQDALKIMAPGTPLREGLENIRKAKTGGLIVIGDSENIMEMVDGGFFINKEYSPSFLYELAKMDGAIVISEDLKRILYANVLLIPDFSISTNETGTRHKCAERVAKQTNKIVISISQRRNVITLYKGSHKHTMKEVNTLLARANQAIQTLEKYKLVLDKAINNLSILEFEDSVTLEDVAIAVQRMEMVMRIVVEIEWYMSELGNESRLIEMQLKELLSNIEEEGLLLIEDYMSGDLITHKGASEARKQIRQLRYESIMDLSYICNVLGYRGEINSFDVPVYSRGLRILSKIHRIPSNVLRNLVFRFENLQGILNASVHELYAVEGIGEIRAKIIKSELDKIKYQMIMERITLFSPKN